MRSRTDGASVRGLRANSFAAQVMLLVEVSLGIAVSLYATVPTSDRGKGWLAAFGAAVSGGPVLLTLHALLGTLLLLTAISAAVRALLSHGPALLVIATLALLAILVAWVAGARFVGTTSDTASLVMALATMVALLCYSTILLIASSGG